MATGIIRPRTLPYHDVVHSFRLELQGSGLVAADVVDTVNGSASDMRASYDPDDTAAVFIASDSLATAEAVCQALHRQLHPTSQITHIWLASDEPEGPELTPGAKLWRVGETQFELLLNPSRFSDFDINAVLQRLSRRAGLTTAYSDTNHGGVIVIVSDEPWASGWICSAVSRTIEVVIAARQELEAEPAQTYRFGDSPDAWRPQVAGWYEIINWNSGLLIRSQRDFQPAELEALRNVVQAMDGSNGSLICHDFICIGYEPDLDATQVYCIQQAIEQWFDTNNWRPAPEDESLVSVEISIDVETGS